MRVIKLRSMSVLAGVALAIAGLYFLAGNNVSPTVEAAPSKTAQSIMVKFTAAGTYTVSNNTTYKFNVGAGSTFFTNAWDGNAPTATCTGNNCSASYPTTPAAPAPDNGKLIGGSPGGNIGNDGVVGGQRCTFLDGGSLTGDTYTQAVVLTPSPGKKYTFTYTYNITPTVPTVDPFTAWDEVSSTGNGSAHVPVGAFIAGESVVSSNQHPKKYSFSLRDDLGASRITNLNVNVDGVDYPATSTLVENAPGAGAGDPGALDFLYTGNAGSNGVTTLLANGNARDILNNDSFAGNQNGGADGKALAAAIMDEMGFDLAEGSHTITLTGTVKGNSASANLPISVTVTVNVITPGCGSGNGNN